MNDKEQQAHAEKMRVLQKQQREKTRQASDAERGLVFVHTGNGKGKSSSAFGVIARALGWGHQVGVVQYIKGKWETGEKNFFAKFPESVDWYTMGDGFTWNTQDLKNDTLAAQAALKRAAEMLHSGQYDLVVLDEINIALRYDYLDVSEVIAALEQRDTRTSVILTGRDAKPELCEYADLVSDMVEIKHPFQSGIKAKQGLDF